MISIKKAKKRMEEFDPRGSKCPICKRNFRKGCAHSVSEATDRLFEDYVHAIYSTPGNEGVR